MAWRNIRLSLDWGSGCQCDITNFDLLDLNYWPTYITNYVDTPTGTISDFQSGTMFGTAPNYVSGSKSAPSCTLNIYMSGYSMFIYGNEIITDDYRWGFIAAVDDETQKGFFAVVLKSIWGNDIGWWSGEQPPTVNNNRRNGLYTLLTGNEQIIYNWVCLDAIRGEFGEIPLAQIKPEYINNGQPATDGISSYFSALPTSALVENIGSGGTTLNPNRYYIETNGEEPGTELFEVYRRMTAYNYSNSEGGNINFYGYIDNQNLVYNDYIEHDAWLAILVDYENESARVSYIWYDIESGFYYYNDYGESHTQEDFKKLYTILDLSAPPDSNQINDDTGEPADWTPRIDRPIPAPTEPSKSAIATGFTPMYKVTDDDLKDLSAFLWSDDFWDVVGKFFDNPSQAIIGLSIFPVSPKTASGKTTISPGGIATPAEGYKLTSQYRDVDMGTKYIKPAGYSFLDFHPFTKCKIFLPYCGIHDLDMNDIMGKTLNLHYIIDFLTGSCVAYILVNGSLHYSFSGVMNMPVPISKSSYDQIVSSVISTGVGVGTLLITTATGGLTSPAAIGALTASGINSMNIHPNISYSSGGGGGNGLIGGQTPFLIYEEPIPKLPKYQNSYLGRPTFARHRLGDLSGFTQCIDAHLLNMSCTQEEQAEILNYLKNGVLIESGSSTPELTPASGNTMFRFLKNKSENNVIGKTWSNSYLDVEGSLIFNQSITSPQLTITGDIRGYNYVYAPVFNRFYYIDDIRIDTGNLQTVSLKVDTLQSFKSEILDCYAVVQRQKTKTNKYFNDPEYWTQLNKDIKTDPFDNIFERNDNAYVLVIAGDSDS